MSKKTSIDSVSVSTKPIPPGATVQQLIQAALDTGDVGTVVELSKEAKLNRMAIWHILRGLPPPRTQKGRLTARRDPRYARLGKCLGFNESDFIALVEREQLSHDSNSPAATTSKSHDLSFVWRHLASSPCLTDSSMTPYLRYFHGIVWASRRNEGYVPPQDVTVPAADVRNRVLREMVLLICSLDLEEDFCHSLVTSLYAQLC
jgi:hypothetical protein